MTEPPTLELCDGLILDGWADADADAHRCFAVDPAAARFLGWTVEEAESASDEHYLEVVRRFQREWVDGTRLSLAIRERAGGDAIGAVEVRPDGEGANVSYLVEPAWRGRGIAARAVDAFLAWAKRELGLRHVTLEAHVDNTASQRVAENCGFTLTGQDGETLRYNREL